MKCCLIWQVFGPWADPYGANGQITTDPYISIPKIRYGIEIYGSVNKTQSKRLLVVSNKLLKILFCMSPLHSTIQLHQVLDILQVIDVYKASVLKFVFLCLRKISLPMFIDYYQSWRNMHDRNLRDLNVLHVPEGYSAMALSSTKFRVLNCGTICP